MGGAILIGGFTLNVATCGGFAFGVGVTTNTGLALISMGLVTTTYHAQDMSMPTYRSSGTTTQVASPVKNEEGKNTNTTPSDGPNNNKKKPNKKLTPNSDAIGAHSAYRRDPQTGKVIKYETYQPQTNLKNPKPWESMKRYDGPGSESHYNKFLKKEVNVPHVHDPYYPGGIRPALPWESPK